MSKRVLITGAGSYIGTSFEKWLSQYPGKYNITTIDMQDDAWQEKSFAGFDTVFHVAGIAHADTGRTSDDTRQLYFEVNCDLAVRTAVKAKSDGAGQFIFMSSIIAYGSKNAIINKDTVPQPDSFYGDSKLQADIRLLKLSDDAFNVAIIRPPMVYGKGCKGNFPRLAALAGKTPVFPDYPNKRSMIYIDNLCEFIKRITDSGADGIFMPQNAQYVNTTGLVRSIAAAYGRKIRTTKLFNPGISLMKNHVSSMGKLFGDLVYEFQGDENDYNVAGFDESIRRSVGDAAR